MREHTYTRILFATMAVVVGAFLAFAFTHPAEHPAVKPVAEATSTSTQAKKPGASTSTTAKTTASSSTSTSTSASPSASPTPEVSVQPLLDPAEKYLGVAQDGVPNSMTGLTTLSKQIGKTPDLVAYYVPWGEPLNQTWVLNITNDGAMPLIQFEPDTPSIADIAGGASDAYATTLADTIKNLNVPVVFSFGHEMNGNWFAWGTTGTTPANFVTAWKRIHNIFTKAGATNVIWLWDVNVTYPVPDVELEPLYPGDAYVDWIGLTGYYNVGNGGRSTFDTLFEPTMDEVRDFTQKPFLIAETAVSPSSEKPQEISNLFANVADHSDVLGFVWFNYDKSGTNEADWMLDSDPLSASTFASLAKGSQWGFHINP